MIRSKIRDFVISPVGRKVTAAAVAVTPVLFSLGVCADTVDGFSTVADSVSTSLESSTTSCLTLFGTLIPYGISIFIAMFAVKKAKQIFNRVTAG